MDKQTFNFELLDTDTPEVVIKNSLKQIEEATRGYVCGRIEKYDGPVRSYIKKSGIAAMIGSLQTNLETGSIQEDLGEQDKEKHRYEVFLIVKGLEHYRYRMMFVDYGAVSYPVMIVMNQDLALEYSGKWSDTFQIDSMKKLEEMMNKVINSETMLTLIQNLINESLRQEAKEAIVSRSAVVVDEV